MHHETGPELQGIERTQGSGPAILVEEFPCLVYDRTPQGIDNEALHAIVLEIPYRFVVRPHGNVAHPYPAGESSIEFDGRQLRDDHGTLKLAEDFFNPLCTRLRVIELHKG
jgi:hypothetical protein